MDFLSNNVGPIAQGAGMISTIAGAATSAKGVKAEAKGNAQAELFNAGMAATNAKTALMNADYAGEAGAITSGIQGMKTRQAVAGILAGQAAGGVDVTSESAVNVRASESQKGMFDAMTIQSNAAREAYGFQTEAVNLRAQEKLHRNNAVYTKQAGDITAKSTLLSGIGTASNSFAEYMMKNSVVGGSGGGTTGGGGGSSYYEGSNTWIDWNS